ncbi:MAG: acyl-CoA dehydrogenase family protein [Microthrixaceae bacterium]|nr:acyl-CoA dehydrogenase family protein [Microthrixaceae bacterium]
MIRWSDEQEMVRQAVRSFVDSEIRPHREALEFGDMAPYDLLRKMFRTFGMDAMARTPSPSGLPGSGQRRRASRTQVGRTPGRNGLLRRSSRGTWWPSRSSRSSS